MTQLISKLGNNIKTLKYDAIAEIWIVEYKNGLNKDKVTDSNIIDFIQNA